MDQIQQNSSLFLGSQTQNLLQQNENKNSDQKYISLHNGIPFKYDLDIQKSIFRKQGEFPPDISKILKGEQYKQQLNEKFESIQTRKNKVINQFASYSPRLKDFKKDNNNNKQQMNNKRVYDIIEGESKTYINSKNSFSSSILLLQSPSQVKELKLTKKKKSNRHSRRKFSLINSISSKLLFVNNNSDDIDYLDLFLREENEQRNKYIINQSNLEVIDMIDQILLQKQQVQKKFSSKKSVINNFQSPKSTLINNSAGQQSRDSLTPFNLDITANRHQLQAQLESFTPRINLKPVQAASTINSSQESKKRVLPIVAEVLKDEANMQKEQMLQKRNNNTKNQIKIIQGNHYKVVNKIVQKQCSCGVRDFIKQMIRKIRNMDNSEQMLQQMKSQLVDKLNGVEDSQQDVLKICAHDFEHNIKEEQKLIYLQLFDKFQEQVYINMEEESQKGPEDSNKMKVERKKPIIFRRFIKFILSEEDTFNPMIQQLQKYIIENNLMYGTIEYSDFYRYNKFMAIMRKKKQKLQKDDIPKLDLEESEDSSISENSSEQNDNMRMNYVIENKNQFEPQSNFLSSNVYTENNSPLTSPTSPRKNIIQQDFQLIVQDQIQQQVQPPQIVLPLKKQKIPILQLYKSDRITGQNLNRQINENIQSPLDLNVQNSFQLTISEKMYRNFLLKMTSNHNEDLNQFQEIIENQSLGNDEVFINISQQKLEKSINESLKFVIKQLKELKTLKDAREQQLLKRQQHADFNKQKQDNPKYTDPQILNLKNTLEHSLEENLVYYEKMYQQKFKKKDNSQLQVPISPNNLQRGLSLNNQAIHDLINSKSKDKKYKKKEDLNENTMKLYHNDFQKQIFFQQAKMLNEHPDDGFKEKNAVLVKYYKECKKKMILPQPHFLKLFKNKVLAIQGEPISIEKCQALKEIIIESNEKQIQDFQFQQLIIDDAAINDQKLKIILEAVKQNDLKKITLMNSVMGKESTRLLIDILQKKSPNEVQELRLVNIKGLEYADHFNIQLLQEGQPPSYIDQILSELIEQNQIIQLQLSNLVLSEAKIVSKLGSVILNNNQLLELDLSFSKFSIYQFHSIIQSLGKYQNTIQQLSLRGINILKLPTTMETSDEISESIYEKKELVETIVKDLCKYVNESICLYHLDLSQMSLGKYLLEIAENSLSKNKSLLSIHLSSNELNFIQIKELLEIFNIDILDAFPQIWSSLGIIDLKGPNSTPSFLQDELISSALFSNLANEQSAKTPSISNFHIKPTTNEHNNQQSEIKKLIMGDFLKNYKNQENLMKSIKNLGEKRIADIDTPDQIVIQRKNGFPESIHNEKIKNILFRKYKEIDFGNLNLTWQLRLDNNECYYCNNYNYYKIFYRRSLADEQFQRIIDPEEINKLKNQLTKYGIFENPHDPIKSNPIILGSIFDQNIPYARLINVKEQAILVWALQEINKIKDKNDDKKIKMLKQTIKQLQVVMNYGIDNFQNLEEQKNQIKDNIQEIKVIFQYFSNWRQFIFPGEEYEKMTKSQYQILNFPMFQESNPKEDDIFIFNGFIRPDNHKIIIYDPQYNAFFKKENITVSNRPKDMKLQRNEFNIEYGDLVRALPIENINDSLNKTEFYLQQMKGENKETYSSMIFGDLIIDFTQKIQNSAYEHDFDIKLFKFSQFIKSKDQEVEQIQQIMKENYNIIMGIWRYYEQKILINQYKEIDNLKKLQQNYTDDQIIQINLNNFISLLKSLFRNTQIYKEIKNIAPQLQKNPEGQKSNKQFNIFRLIVQEVYDTIAYCYTGEKYQYSSIDPNKIQTAEPLKKQLTSQLFGKQEIQKIKPNLQRRMLPLCLLRLSHHLSANIYGLQADKVFFRAINYCQRFLKLPANGQETVQKNLILYNDIGYLKNQYLFKNKALCAFLKFNKKGIHDHLYQKLLSFTYQNQIIGFHQGGKNLPSNSIFTINRNDACNTESSLDKLLELINNIQTKYKRNNGEEITLILPTINICKRLALESKINLIAQDIDSEIHQNSLKFEEFIIFLILVSIYMQNSQIRERFEPLEKQESEEEATIQSNTKKEDQSSIKNPFLLGCLAIENINLFKGKSLFKRMKINIALNLQDFINQLYLSKAFEFDQDEDKFIIEELDSTIFAYDQQIIVQEEQIVDTKTKK